MDTGFGNDAQHGFVRPLAYITNRNGAGGSLTSANVLRSDIENAPVYFSLENGVDLIRTGPIVTSSLAAGGSGYAVNDTGTVNTQVYTGGATYTVNSGGDGYHTTSNPVSTTHSGAQAGSGTGFTINVNSIPAADGTIYYTLFYRILTLH